MKDMLFSSTYIDCLLVGYRGFNYNDINDKLKRTGKGTIKIQKMFNGAISVLGSYLASKNLTFDYINYLEDLRDTETEVFNNNILAIGFSTTYCTNFNEVKICVNKLRKANSNSKIIVGGTFIAKFLKSEETSNITMMLKYINADFYVSSFYGEDILSNILFYLKGKIAIDKVPNVIYKIGRKYVFTFAKDERSNLENSIVNWSLFQHNIGSIVPVRTSISCNFNCSFCAFPIFAGKYETINLNIVEKELNDINNINEVKSIRFIDDTFNVPNNRFEQILKIMIKNEYHFKWHGYIRCQFLNKDIVRLMKESKCEAAILGIESASQIILNNMNKKASIEDMRNGIQLLHENNITTMGLFMIGFPGETEETVRETISFINSVPLDFYDVKPWFYEVKTPITKYKDIFNLSGENKEWSHISMNSEEAEKYTRLVIDSVKASRLCYDFEAACQLMDNQEQLANYLNIEKILTKRDK
jgi:anaerobic magnesium-protoporphyrin IX monomethyl ester cyclase